MEARKGHELVQYLMSPPAVTKCDRFSFLALHPVGSFASSARPEILWKGFGFSLVKNFTSSTLPALHRASHGKHFSSLVQSTASQNRCLRRGRSRRSGTCLLLLRDAEALGAGYQPSQPIPFSHKIHVDQVGLDCRYCHSFVDVDRPLERADRQHLLELPPARPA